MKLGLSLAAYGSKAYDFIAVGENSLDRVCLMASFPRPDQKHRLLDFRELPGGQAATAAVACARLGWRSRYIGAVGDDKSGTTVLAALDREHIDSCVVIKPGVPTRTAVVLVDESSGSRTVLESRDPRLALEEGAIPAEVFTEGRIMLVDGTDPALSRRAAKLARSAGTRVLLDVDTADESSIALMQHADVVIAPASFVESAARRAGVGAALAALGERLNAAAIIATQNAQGAVAWCRGEEVRVPAHPVDVVDSTGAGDAFRGGFAAAWLDAGADPQLESLLRFAARVAALNCRDLGAQTALPTAADLQV